jgi:predicted ATP-grasp superfamily ATP-dependent carboligase
MDNTELEKSRGRVIVTYSRSWQALAAIRSLGRHGVEVIAGDEYKLAPGSLSSYTKKSFLYPAPDSDPEAFLTELERAVDTFAPSDPAMPYVLMPIHQETYLINKHRARFAGKISLPLAPSEAFERLQHKGRLSELADEIGVPAPRTWIVKDIGELEELTREVQYPAFVKLPARASGVGVHRVEDRTELIETYKELVERYGLSDDGLPIIQAVAAGDDYCTTALFDRGRLVATLTYRNVVTFPGESGPGAIRETVAAEPLEKITERLLAHVGWHGIAQLDFRWTGRKEDEPLLLEANPRFFGGLYQAIASGIDYPWLLFQVACGRSVEPPSPPAFGTRTETPIIGLLAMVQEIVESATETDQLDSAFAQFRTAFGQGASFEAIQQLVWNLPETVDMKGRLDKVRQLLEENSNNLSWLLDGDDPLPVLGLLYPLSVFVRHGKLSKALLSGASSDGDVGSMAHSGAH